MNDPTDRHVPDPEFRARLEWQVASALRRESRFTSPVRSGGWRRLRVAVVLLATLGVGGAAGLASAQVQDSREQALLLASARSRQELVRLRLELARAEAERVRQAVQLGTMDQAALLSVEARLQAQQASLEHAALDIAEIEITSTAPRDELSAPLVDGRDFVRQRLMLDFAAREQALAPAEAEAAQARRNLRLGMATELAVGQAETELARVRGELELARARIAVRDRFLSGALTADQVPTALRRMEIELELQQARREFELAERRVAELRQRNALGTAHKRDLLRAELTVVERQFEMEQLVRELELVRGGG